MPMPTDPGEIRAIDLMMNIPGGDHRQWYQFMQPLFLDEQSQQFAKMPVEYMFKSIPDIDPEGDTIGYTLAKMDELGVDKAMLGISEQNPQNLEAVRKHPDRFFPSLQANPNRGMETVREIVRAKEELGIKAVTAFPSGLCPQVPIDDKKWYPIYAKCVELDLPICICVGVPGPRLPMDPQKVERLDEVCWFFPELKIVMRHGAEPWVDLAVKLMIKYPNLYYSTTAFAPKHYPRAIVDYANTRGSDKIMYGGYFPMGLSLDRIFRELPEVPFADDVWPKFLHENARRVFDL